MIKFDPTVSTSLLDLSCRPGTSKKFLSGNVHYTGIDLDKNYVTAKKLSYPDSKFYLGRIQEMNDIIPSNSRFDYINAIGLFYRSNDMAARNCFEAIKEYAKQGSYIINFEPCYVDKQSFILKRLMAMNLGQCLWHYNRWVRLVAFLLPHVSHSVRRSYRISYAHIALTINC